MSKEKYYKTLLSPHVTEKASMSLGENAQAVFKVAKDAKKIDINPHKVIWIDGQYIKSSILGNDLVIK